MFSMSHIISGFENFVNMYFHIFVDFENSLFYNHRCGGEILGLKENLITLRETLGISQEELGNKIGLSRFSVSNYESGKRNVTDRVVQDICREFNINEAWLRTGEGTAFVEILPEDEYTAAAAEISKSGDKLAMQAVIEYWKLDDDSKKLLKDFIVHIVNNAKNKE